MTPDVHVRGGTCISVYVILQYEPWKYLCIPEDLCRNLLCDYGEALDNTIQHIHAQPPNKNLTCLPRQRYQHRQIVGSSRATGSIGCMVHAEQTVSGHAGGRICGFGGRMNSLVLPIGLGVDGWSLCSGLV